MKIKYYNLKEWDKAIHYEEEWILTFNKLDWMYAKWTNEQWEIVIWHALEYEMKDWIYYPVTIK